MKNIKSSAGIKFLAFIMYVVMTLTCVLSTSAIAYLAYNGAYNSGEISTESAMQNHTDAMVNQYLPIIVYRKIFLNETGRYSYYELSKYRTNFLYEVKSKDGEILETNMEKDTVMVNTTDCSDKVFNSPMSPFDYSRRVRFRTENEAKEYMDKCSVYFNVLDYEISERKYYFDEEDDEELYYDYWYHEIFAETEEYLYNGEEVHTTMLDEDEDSDNDVSLPVPIKTDSDGDKYYTAYEVKITGWQENSDALVCTVGRREDMTAKDTYWYIQMIADNLSASGNTLIWLTVITAFLSLALFVFLMSAAGYKAGVEGIHLNLFDRIPYDLILVAVGAGVFGLVYLFYLATDYYFIDIGSMLMMLASIFGIIVVIPIFCITTATRIKSRDILRNWIILIVPRAIFRGIKKVHRAAKKFFELIPLYWQAALGIGIWFIADIIFTCFFVGMGIELIVFIIGKLVVVPLILLAVVNMRAIQKGGEQIAKGNINYKINTNLMYPPFRKHAQNLNEIGGGLDKALDEKLKSERMKTELITNVSHDIKTPLTSIINYVDILKREGLGSPNAAAYLEVIDRQSIRLKKLTEDLVEMSKASTGNINVNITDVDVNVLLTQAAGEYSEKLQARGLEAVVNLQENAPHIKADGNLLWRIFDNLLSNICKYAKYDTRVYLETAVRGDRVVITFKNISNQALNIPGDELMERFVRGDSSRNTEGSGLGLSIAQSLAKLQNAEFKIDIDGDLFKSIISFRI